MTRSNLLSIFDEFERRTLTGFGLVSCVKNCRVVDRFHGVGKPWDPRISLVPDPSYRFSHQRLPPTYPPSWTDN